MENGPDLARLTAEMFIAYVTNNKVEPNDVENVVRAIRTAISGKDGVGEAGDGGEGVAAARSEPAVPIDELVQPDYVICLEDGRRFKSLKRHLSLHGLTPQDYRERWGLPGRLSDGGAEIRQGPVAARQENRAWPQAFVVGRLSGGGSCSWPA